MSWVSTLCDTLLSVSVRVTSDDTIGLAGCMVGGDHATKALLVPALTLTLEGGAGVAWLSSTSAV